MSGFTAWNRRQAVGGCCEDRNVENAASHKREHGGICAILDTARIRNLLHLSFIEEIRSNSVTRSKLNQSLSNRKVIIDPWFNGPATWEIVVIFMIIVLCGMTLQRESRIFRKSKKCKRDSRLKRVYFKNGVEFRDQQSLLWGITWKMIQSNFHEIWKSKNALSDFRDFR